MTQLASDPTSLYQATLDKWSREGNGQRRNALFRQNQAAFKAIRSSSEGQDLIRRLAEHEDDAITGVAATHALWFDETLGTRILARIAESSSPSGLSAAWTLREHSRGASNLDW